MINVMNHGVSHDFIDQSDIINELLERGECLFFPNGYYRLDKPIKLSTGAALVGDNATFVVLGDTALEGSDISDIHIQGFKINIDASKSAIKLHTVSDVFISDIASSGGGVWINTTYPVGEEIECNHNIHISNVRAFNDNWVYSAMDSGAPFAKGVYVEFADGVFIKDCNIEGQAQGIQIWGGNAADTAERQCHNVLIENCVVKNCSGGGIWGSEVDKFIVRGCTVDHTLDVGIDFEGCDNALAAGNIVSNCRCGNYSVFFESPNVSFADNISRCDSEEYINESSGKPYGAHFSLYNSANNPYDDTIIIDNCQFVSTNGVVGEVTWGACRNRIIRDCYFLNSKLCYNDNTTGHANSEITANKFYFDMDIDNICAITSQSHNNMGYHSIRNNTIQVGDGEGGIANARNCIGIKCIDFNAESRHVVSDNLIYGMNTGIKGKSEGNKTLYIVANNNVMNSPISTEGSVNIVKNNNISMSGSAKW